MSQLDGKCCQKQACIVQIRPISMNAIIIRDQFYHPAVILLSYRLKQTLKISASCRVKELRSKIGQ